MSGHNKYTTWIDEQAKYILVNGKKEEIKDTFFTNSPIHNSDYFNIQTSHSTYQEGDELVNWDELRERYEKAISKKDADVLFEGISKPKPPNEKLIKAANEFKKMRKEL